MAAEQQQQQQQQRSRTKIECTAQKNEIPVRRMHKEMLNIGKIKESTTEQRSKWWKSSKKQRGVGHQRQMWVASAKCNNLHAAHTHAHTQTIGNREAVEYVAGTAGEKMQLGDSMAR